MPPQTRKRKTSATESNDAFDSPPKKTTRAQRKTAPKAATTRKEKTAASKPGNFAINGQTAQQCSEAKKQVQKQGDDVVKEIDKEFETRSPQIDRSKLMREISPDLVIVLPWMHSSPVSTKIQTFPQIMLKALDDLRSHVHAYKKTVKQGTGIRVPNHIRWVQDAKDLEDMNEHGLQMVKKIINHTVMPSSHELPTKPAESESGVEEVAWELIEEALPRESKDIWGKIALGQMKALRAILKVLPVEE
ncbi:60s ribosomal l15 [Fusarium longipes]|uniref:60s ribosomal l15 n=1 Tax=Fusarium longipes TaxID=694270 RepID=A0A395SXX5_9HYPO|nr:60s ribosomal l15 [Fusarium longipes]